MPNIYNFRPIFTYDDIKYRTEYVVGIDFGHIPDMIGVSLMCKNCRHIIFSKTENHSETLNIPVLKSCPKCKAKFDGFVGIIK